MDNLLEGGWTRVDMKFTAWRRDKFCNLDDRMVGRMASVSR